jgi:uncharacterized SAM-binding protein YcdF (DUF218 family)
LSLSVGFILKKIVGRLLMPLSVCLFFFGLGLLYLFLRRFRDAIAPFVIGLVLLYGFSLNTVAGRLIGPLERYYPACNLSDPSIAQMPVKWVVVLGSGHRTNPLLPPAAMLKEASLFRLVEGLRVTRHFQDAVLILGGGTFLDEQSNAQVMAAAAISLGFDPGRIILMDKVLDTHDEVVQTKAIVGDDPFVLVTSASHMLRSMKLFGQEGLRPLPAPAHYRYRGDPEIFVPRPANIETCHLAVHEYLGLIWAFLRGQISMTESP